MANETDTQTSMDEWLTPEPAETEEERKKRLAEEEAQRADAQAELDKTDRMLRLAGAMDQTIAPLPTTMPTQTAPVAAPMAPPRNNSYMGPNIASPDASPQQFFRDNPFLQGTHSFITPPEPSPEAAARVAYGTGGESDRSRLARLQAADQPGTRTIGTHTEDPYSDASVANQRNQMIYGAMKAYQGGDRSSENVALLMSQTAMPGGRASPYAWGMTPGQQAANAIASGGWP